MKKLKMVIAGLSACLLFSNMASITAFAETAEQDENGMIYKVVEELKEHVGEEIISETTAEEQITNLSFNVSSDTEKDIKEWDTFMFTIYVNEDTEDAWTCYLTANYRWTDYPKEGMSIYEDSSDENSSISVLVDIIPNYEGIDFESKTDGYDVTFDLSTLLDEMHGIDAGDKFCVTVSPIGFSYNTDEDVISYEITYNNNTVEVGDRHCTNLLIDSGIATADIDTMYFAFLNHDFEMTDLYIKVVINGKEKNFAFDLMYSSDVMELWQVPEQLQDNVDRGLWWAFLEDGTQTYYRNENVSYYQYPYITDLGIEKGDSYEVYFMGWRNFADATDEMVLQPYCARDFDFSVQEISPKIIYGADSTWTFGSDEGLVVSSNADISDFIEVRVDGNTVEQSNYTITSGSTVITLNKEYLNGLSVGEHMINIVSENGIASTYFKIQKQVTNADVNTGDIYESNIGKITVFFIATFIIVIVSYKLAKKSKPAGNIIIK